MSDDELDTLEMPISPVARVSEQLDAHDESPGYYEPWGGQAMYEPRSEAQWDDNAITVSAGMLSRGIDEVAGVQGVKRRAVIKGLAKKLDVPYARIVAWSGSGIPNGKLRAAVWKFIERGLDEKDRWTAEDAPIQLGS